MGAIAIGGALNYFVSARRVIAQRPGALSARAVLLNGVAGIVMLGFSVTEYRAWLRLTAGSAR